jgi:hypothetical protein
MLGSKSCSFEVGCGVSLTLLNTKKRSGVSMESYESLVEQCGILTRLVTV